MEIGLFAKLHRPDFAEKLEEIVTWLRGHGCEPLVDGKVVEHFGLKGVPGTPPDEIARRAEAVVVFGGDGTLLGVARLVKAHDTPILGVNLGSLGFLTEVSLDRLYTDLQALIEGRFAVEERCMVKASMYRRQAPEAPSEFHAVNDIVVNKAALARVITVDAFFDDQFIASFVADGMIVSTPTGSTAYSLSAGGPIVYPLMECLVITPICPHTLSNRPLVIPARQQLRLLLRSGTDVMLTVDGQVGVAFREGDEIVCTLSPHRLRLVRSGNRGFFELLREKLNWAKR